MYIYIYIASKILLNLPVRFSRRASPPFLLISNTITKILVYTVKQKTNTSSSIRALVVLCNRNFNKFAYNSATKKSERSIDLLSMSNHAYTHTTKIWLLSPMKTFGFVLFFFSRNNYSRYRFNILELIIEIL